MERYPALHLLKLGGSLITDKQRPFTPRLDILQRLAAEIRQALQDQPERRIILGHGAGSFGHVPAKKYGTRQGVRNAEEWLGFAEVWKEANALNRLVMDALLQAGLPAIALPPSSSVVARDGKVAGWDLRPMRAILEAGLLPVVFGDVIVDLGRGGTILSTEDLFDHLARQLKPQRILLAGIEEGVWADFPACTRLVSEITRWEFEKTELVLEGSHAVDVTGGMASKVQQSLELVNDLPSCTVVIFSGEAPGKVLGALNGDFPGTTLRAE